MKRRMVLGTVICILACLVAYLESRPDSLEAIAGEFEEPCDSNDIFPGPVIHIWFDRNATSVAECRKAIRSAALSLDFDWAEVDELLAGEEGVLRSGPFRLSLVTPETPPSAPLNLAIVEFADCRRDLVDFTALVNRSSSFQQAIWFSACDSDLEPPVFVWVDRDD